MRGKVTWGLGRDLRTKRDFQTFSGRMLINPSQKKKQGTDKYLAINKNDMVQCKAIYEETKPGGFTVCCMK